MTEDEIEKSAYIRQAYHELGLMHTDTAIKWYENGQLTIRDLLVKTRYEFDRWELVPFTKDDHYKREQIRFAITDFLSGFITLEELNGRLTELRDN